MIRFAHDVCTKLELASSKEWLETNGLGGFASSTIIGLNTRRYHGLLVAAVQPPVGRMVLLAKLEETLHCNGQTYDLGANRYPGVVHPRGFEFLREFRLDPWPVFVYSVGGLEIVKRVFMVHGENTTVVQYEVASGDASGAELELRPLLAFRDYHSMAHANSGLNSVVRQEPGLASIQPYPDQPRLYFAHNAAAVETTGDWYRNFEYEVEQQRGLDFQEDLFQPCVLRFPLQGVATLIASTERREVTAARGFASRELERRRQLTAHLPAASELVKTLTAAADQYIVSRGEEKTVIAGYHWFSDWGRDTMIALPGLTLPAGRYDVARSVLRTFAQAANQGMLPNRFPDAGEQPEYNTVDATLWFFEAARAYAAASNDFDFVRKHLYSALTEIVGWHVRGTRYNIKVDSGGLINAGEAGVQLTWMDAKVGDWVVTPRRGKPVEIQALWYNALMTMGDFAQRFGDTQAEKRFRTMAALTHWSFNRIFWNEEGNYLYDVVDEGPPDAAIRPNQIFAVSLHHGMLSRERALAVVENVRQHLLTPYGLRSLAPSDPAYRGRYQGGPAERDGTYHQGTVWPWLIGPFLMSYLKVNESNKQSRQQVRQRLLSLEAHLLDAGLAHISEIFDGDVPQRPAGCIAQAWSVAEVLRVCAALGDESSEAVPVFGRRSASASPPEPRTP